MASPSVRSMSTTSPAELVSTPVDGVNVLGALSPSRAADFMSCPLMYRLRSVDKLPEEPSIDAVRGTVVHRVLEQLFDLPAAERTPLRAEDLIDPSWAEVQAQEADAAAMFESAEDAQRWLASCRSVLAKYFDLEDPTRLEPAERELYVESILDSKLLLRGFVDRVDVAPTGEVRIVDYKSGRAPGEMFEAKALFQLKFYALAWWKTRGVVPTMLQLIYLGSGDVLRYQPDEADLRATERKINAIWTAIQAAQESGDWRHSPSRLCSWCSYQAHCPEFGGTPPPLPSATAPVTDSVEE